MGKENMNSIPKHTATPAEIMQFMTHSSLSLYKKKGSRAPFDKLFVYQKAEEHAPYRKGAVFVSPSKEDLSEGKGYVVTSYETLAEKHSHLSHWTPNVYRGGTYYDFRKRIIKGHKRENLKQVSVIGFDIDTKETDLYALYIGCEELGLPRPNLLLETPRGYQFFFVLSTPFYVHSRQDYKSLRIAERISDNLKTALSAYVPLDKNCVPFGFYRIPRHDNILDFYEHTANTSRLLSWSKQFEEKEKRRFLRVVHNRSQKSDLCSTDWYRALISATEIDRGYNSASRNNALMTLALANYASGRSFEDAYDELDQFNSFLDRPLSKTEFDKTINSAYSGKYKGVKRSYVEGMLELWTDGQAKFHGRDGWYKFKKERSERERSHYEEWEEDIVTYIEQHMSPDAPFLEGSLPILAERFGMAVSSLKEVLKRSTKIVKKTIGRGRGAVTKISSRNILFKSLLESRKKASVQAKQTMNRAIAESISVFFTGTFSTQEELNLFRNIELPVYNTS
ncbi:primase C-terminal domain-containing protein [Metabacillus idriensis]|uniref:primase C-terminal domain-containing protein n=1 Tax=Metabacillus idriensis TaxID=324768 RepID=UPI0028145297|nr:primase C-terminal domain-containing protein [Metabacillus idriensis]MDR0140136.1 primase C-terminal domain-containing protein [Metabacillus idriensis]